MNREDLIIQISTGGYLEHRVTYEEIYHALNPLISRIPVKGVIIGWSCDRILYGKVLKFLHEKDIKCYLWLPVFSETGLMADDIGRLVDSRDREVMPYILSEGENFEFYCPNQERNSAAFLDTYEKQFGGLPFDGVFLDKIRYATFANGREGVFSCFCPECMERYKMFGIDPELLREEMDKVQSGQGVYGKRALGITGYAHGRYKFENPIWESFFRKKAEDIEQALRPVVNYFHSKDMLVGMDTFAPFLGYFAGQDTERLAALADFVKPMMYRLTAAPAGLPFETECLLRETISGEPGTVRERREAAAEQLFGMLGAGAPFGGSFDLEFVKSELAYMAALPIPVYCGIEVNRNPVAPVTPDYIRENLSGLKSADVQGYVLSWDILSAPEENIGAVADYFRKEG